MIVNDTYFGKHAVTFMNSSDFSAYCSSGGRTKHMHSWNDLHLIPATKFIIPPAEIKENMIDIPGRDGFVDLTEVLTNRPVYGKRTGSLEFMTTANDYEDWTITLRKMTSYVHGRSLMLLLDDEPGFFYEGRFSVNSWKSEAQRDKVTVNYELQPYKRTVFGEDDYWMWDPFSFINGIITSRKNFRIKESFNMRCPQGDLPGAHPTIILESGELSVSFNGASYPLSSGTNVMSEITFVSGENILAFTGTGVVSIKYKGGWL